MTNTARSLVYLVDDDEDLCIIYQRWLEQAGVEVCVFPDAESVLEGLQEEIPGALCLDMNLPGMTGLDALARIREHNPAIPIVVLTADETANTAVRAMKLGARDYITKPVPETKLVATMRTALEIGRLSARVHELEREIGGYPGIIGSSPAMKAVFRQLDRLAASDVTVLIHGESGTGKELVARAIHDGGSRSRRPFVAINAAAIPESLLESELFGHEKGAFTGALTQRTGRFEEASGGTLFLDEIGELPQPVQAKLLRVLQERSIQRLGGQRTIPTDFRLLTATHKNLAEEVKAGRFRQDLFFRLAVFELDLPPLRARKSDIPALAESFLGGRRLSPRCLEVLLQYDWPGNVRELQNVMQSAQVVAEGDEIQPEDLPQRMRLASDWPGASPRAAAPAAAGEPESATLEDASRRLLAEALRRHAGNASAVMRELKITRPRFYRMIRKFGLETQLESSRGLVKSASA